MIKSIVNCTVSGRAGGILTDVTEIKYVFFFFILKPYIYLSVSNYLLAYSLYFIVKDCVNRVSSHSTYITLVTISL